MADDNIYYRAFRDNYGIIANTVAGGGGPNITNLASYLLQGGLIQSPDHVAAISPGMDPTTIANRLCTGAMNKLEHKPHLYKKLLEAFRGAEYNYLYELLEKTVKEITATQDSDHHDESTPSVSKGKDSDPVEDVSVVLPAADSGIAPPRLYNVQRVVNANCHARGLAVIVTNGDYQKSSKYSSLSFTEKDGMAMEETFKQFNFNCYTVKDLTGDEIQNVVTQTSQCKYPDSYKYVAFVYSGHGDIESTGDPKRSGMVGIDGKLIETTYGVVNPLKSIEPQSMVKMVFLDACRGNHFPPPVTKGRPTNCLVSYATQLGQVSFGATKGSQWMIPLAEKLKQKDRSVQEVLKQVKEEMLNNAWVQYPETDDSDCTQPIYLAREPMESKGGAPAVPRVGEKPNIGDLASFARSDGTGWIRIIDRLLEEDLTVIQSLNHMLLNARDRPAQREPASDEHNKMRFVLEGLTKWLSKEEPKVQPTWENLTECLEDAGLKKEIVKEIKDNLE